MLSCVDDGIGVIILIFDPFSGDITVSFDCFRPSRMPSIHPPPIAGSIVVGSAKIQLVVILEDQLQKMNNKRPIIFFYPQYFLHILQSLSS